MYVLNAHPRGAGKLDGRKIPDSLDAELRKMITRLLRYAGRGANDAYIDVVIFDILIKIKHATHLDAIHLCPNDFRIYVKYGVHLEHLKPFI